MDFRLKLIFGGLLALLLGLAFSMPLLLSNLTQATKIELTVDVQYAYFGVQGFDQNITGLWRNGSDPQELDHHLLTYLIVLNITNHSDKLAYIEKFEAAAAQKIVHEPLDTEVWHLEMENTIVYDVRTIEAYPGWDQYWSPNQSRLIGLSGMVEIQGNAYPAFVNRTLYLYGHVEASPLGEKSISTGSSVKQVQLQAYGKEFLYDDLLFEDQMLLLGNDFDVSVQPRR
jgi:hypothetical protein